MQYTPGPWRQTGVNIRAGDALLAVCTNHYADEHLMESEKLANAKLMSFAPELLDALVRLVHPMADDEDLSDAKELIQRITAS